ncbi:MAG TPA: carboxypeptidase-like regulatory domain-containing protein, partial [Acidobacteriaceae bacterium]|nr:carboxypeptidase-like regulatory domain-containing protein [Acidobacteriaceae bacterium]
MRRIWTLCVLALLTFSAPAFAQGGGNVAITGTVTDPSGAVLPGAHVNVTQVNTSVVRTVVTNDSGQFNVPSLPPGNYSVAVKAEGFKQYVQTVVLLADQIQNLNIHLEIGQATQQVTVQGSSVHVNTVT